MSTVILVITAVCACVITALFGAVLIPFLRKLHFGQTILEIGPKWHEKKQGTPIMGGIMFIVGTLIATALGFGLSFIIAPEGEYAREFSSTNRVVQLIAGVVMALLMGFIGFMDDYIKAVKKRNLGLKASQKTFLQIAVTVGYLLTMFLAGMRTTHIPFIGDIDITSGFGLLFWPVALVFMYGFTNAVNLTDGVDGLASSVTFVVSLFYLVATTMLANWSYNLLSAALAGALVGFLIWNLNPARVFMGDTGSMFLGGIVVAFAFATELPILLFLSGILYLIEAMSVVIQVTYYKRTKKRLFKMSPIHHHFEMSGWNENKIVIVFSLVALVGCALAFAILVIDLFI